VAEFGFGKSDLVFELVIIYVLILMKKELLIFLGWKDEWMFSSQRNVMRQISGLFLLTYNLNIPCHIYC